MIKAMRILSLASLPMTGAATAMAANDGGGVGGKSRRLAPRTGSQQTNTPATGYRSGCDIHPSRTDLPGDGRSDRVDFNPMQRTLRVPPRVAVAQKTNPAVSRLGVPRPRTGLKFDGCAPECAVDCRPATRLIRKRKWLRRRPRCAFRN